MGEYTLIGYNALPAPNSNICPNSAPTEEKTVTLTPPAAPTVPGASVVSGAVRVTWTPANPAGTTSAISGYTVTITPPNGIPVILDAAGASAYFAQTPVTAPGEYRYSIVSYYYSTYTQQRSGNSTAITGTLVTGMPSEPTAASLTVSGGVATLKWSFPASAAGLTVNGYQATIYTPAPAVPATNNPYSQVTRTVPLVGTITGNVTNNTITRSGSDYTWVYYTAASNTAGEYRALISATTTSGVLGLPANVTTDISGNASLSRAPSPVREIGAVIENSKILVSWVSPADPGTHTINSYAITLNSPSGVAHSVTVPISSSPNQALDDTVLATAQGDGSIKYVYKKTATSEGSYSGTVAAVSIAGVGELVPFSTQGNLPLPPAFPDIDVNSGKVLVTWTTPASSGGNPILQYDVVLYGPSGLTVLDDVPVGQNTPGHKSATYTVVDALLGIRTYTWRYDTNVAGAYRAEVRTATIAGRSLPGTALTSPDAIDRPSRPQGLSIDKDTAGTSLIATWTAPTTDGGSSITNYEVTWMKPDGTSAAPSSVVQSVTTLTAGLANAAAGTYTVVVRAQSGAGYGAKTSRSVSLAQNGTINLGSNDPQVTLTAPTFTRDRSTGEAENTLVLTFVSIDSGPGATQTSIIDLPNNSGTVFTAAASTQVVHCDIIRNGESLSCTSIFSSAGSSSINIAVKITKEHKGIASVSIHNNSNELLGSLIIERPQILVLPYNVSLTTASCSPLVVVGLRGSGQPMTEQDGLGNQVYTLAQRINKAPGKYLSVTATAVAYAADDLPYSDADSTLETFFASVTEGKELLDEKVNEVRAACHNSQIIIAGFSQGAWIAQNYTTHLPSAGWQNISAVALMGSPGLASNDGVGRKFGAEGLSVQAPTGDTYGFGTLSKGIVDRLEEVVTGELPEVSVPLGFKGLLVDRGINLLDIRAIEGFLLQLQMIDPDGFLQEENLWADASKQSRVFQICDNNDPVCSADDDSNITALLIDGIDGDVTDGGLTWESQIDILEQLVFYANAASNSVHMGPSYTTNLAQEVANEIGGIVP